MSGLERVRSAVASAVRELCGLGPWPPSPELCAGVAARVVEMLAEPAREHAADCAYVPMLRPCSCAGAPAVMGVKDREALQAVRDVVADVWNVEPIPGTPDSPEWERIRRGVALIDCLLAGGPK